MFLGGALVVSSADGDTGGSLELSLAGVLTHVSDEEPPASADDDLGFKIYLYGWVPAISGGVSIGARSVEVDSNVGDVLGDLDGVLTGRLEVSSGPWVFFVDEPRWSAACSTPT